jgi:hypothetical protein
MESQELIDGLTRLVGVPNEVKNDKTAQWEGI